MYWIRVNGETLATCDDFLKAKKVFDRAELHNIGDIKEVYLGDEEGRIIDRPLMDIKVN